MLTDQDFDTACSTLRSMYTCLTEVEELTQELSQAVSRQDQVSVRMFLSMRQAEIEHLTSCNAALRRQCQQLPPDEGKLLWQMLSGTYTGAFPSSHGETMLHLAKKNRSALERILRADRTVSLRLAGPDSFYNKHQP